MTQKVKPSDQQSINMPTKKEDKKLNSRCDMIDLILCIYDQTICHTCYIIQQMRLLKLQDTILGTKTDMGKMYQRIHILANSAAQEMAIAEELLNILCSPPIWSFISSFRMVVNNGDDCLLGPSISVM